MDHTNMTKYNYVSLPGTRHIRLLRLNRRTDHGIIVTGSLIFRNLDENRPDYTTLSYSWGRNSDGDATLNRTILIDGSSFLIAENLFDFLMEASRPSDIAVELLWIDALCIDQGNLQERGQQVSMMGDIYQRASKLIIWLGHGTNELDDRSVTQLEKFSASWSKSHNSRSISWTPLGELRPEETSLAMSRLQRRAFAAISKPSEWPSSFQLSMTAYEPGVFGSRRPSLSNAVLIRCGVSLWRQPRVWLPLLISKCKSWKQRVSKMLIKHFRNWRWLFLVRFALAQTSNHESLMPLIVHLGPVHVHEQLWMTGNTWLIYLLGRKFFNLLLEALLHLVEAPAKLSQRRYFSRRWIIQEIHHSGGKPITVQWGSCSLDIERVSDLLRKATVDLGGFEGKRSWMDRGIYQSSWLKEYFPKRSLLDNAMAVIEVGTSSESNKINRNAGARRILHHLLHFQLAACSDGRDRIYAFLSLGETPLKADYALSAQDTLKAFACAAVTQGALDSLLVTAAWQYGSSGDREFLEGRDTLPSWIPDIDRVLPPSIETLTTPGEYNCEASVEENTTAVEFQGRIGKLTVPPDQWDVEMTVAQGTEPRKAIRKVKECDYHVCHIVIEGASYDGAFILRPSYRRPGCFVLAGWWRQDFYGFGKDPGIWYYCDASEIKTIRLC